MLKVETICKRAVAFGDADTKNQAREIHNLYLDKYRCRSAQIVKDTWSVQEYKDCLDKHSIEYVEIELEKGNGNKVHMVIPSLIFKNMNSKDISILLKV